MPYSRDARTRSDRIPHVASAALYAVIDVETTGFDPVADRVVEMACTIVDGGRIVSTWTSLVDPQRAIPPRVTRVHGIADRDVRGAPTFDAAARDLVRHCEGAQPVAHNASFDRRFLAPLDDRPWLCTIALARRAYPGAPAYGNQSLRRYLQIDAALGAEHRIVAHRALDDTLVTAHILLRCLEREALDSEAERRGAGALTFALLAE